VGTRFSTATVMTITSTSQVAVPAVGAALNGSARRQTGQILIQPISGKVRYALDAVASDSASPAIGQDVQWRDDLNNQVQLIRDADEGADVSVLVCWEAW
jgi:hypothetical protein